MYKCWPCGMRRTSTVANQQMPRYGALRTKRSQYAPHLRNKRQATGGSRGMHAAQSEFPGWTFETLGGAIHATCADVDIASTNMWALRAGAAIRAYRSSLNITRARGCCRSFFGSSAHYPCLILKSKNRLTHHPTFVSPLQHSLHSPPRA